MKTLLLALALSSSTFAADSLLVCDGDVSFFINQADRSLTVVEDDGSFIRANVTRFDVARCPNCYRVEGSVRTSEGTYAFKVNTRGNGGDFRTATASVEVRDLATGETGSSTVACERQTVGDF